MSLKEELKQIVESYENKFSSKKINYKIVKRIGSYLLYDFKL